MGYVGFQFKNGKIIALVKDSSATRNGLLTDHQILEINGKVCMIQCLFYLVFNRINNKIIR